MSRMHCVISYDIVNNKRRRKLAGLLEGYAARVQYSVFEGWLANGQLKTLVHESARFIKICEGDSFRIYRICASCYPKTVAIGGFIPDWKSAIIV